MSIDWAKRAVELRSRAAQYCAVAQEAGAVSRKHLQSGYFLWEDIEAILRAPPTPGNWWWVYAPLLSDLLSGGKESAALLVCLGHHIGGARGPEDAERQWVHFLPGDFSGEQGLAKLVRLHLFASYNAEFLPALQRRAPAESEAAQAGSRRPVVLTTTAFLEMLSSRCYRNLSAFLDQALSEHQADAASPNHGHEPLPLLWPLSITFDSTPPAGSAEPNASSPVPPSGGTVNTGALETPAGFNQLSLPLLCLDWAGLRSSISTYECRQSGPIAEYLKRLSKRFRQARLQNRPAGSTLIPGGLDKQDDDFLEVTYEIGHLDPCYDQLAADLGAALAETVLGRQDEPTSPAYWLTRAKCSQAEMQNLAKRWLRFAIWVHDLTAPPEFGQILSMLSWLPPTSSGVHSGSIIAYMRKGRHLVPEVSPHQPTLPLFGVSAAFQAGSAFMIDERARDEERLSGGTKIGLFLSTVNRFLRTGSDAMVKVTLANGKAPLWAIVYRGELSFVPKGPVREGVDRLAFIVANSGEHLTYAEVVDLKIKLQPRQRARSQPRDIDEISNDEIRARECATGRPPLPKGLNSRGERDQDQAIGEYMALAKPVVKAMDNFAEVLRKQHLQVEDFLDAEATFIAEALKNRPKRNSPRLADIVKECKELKGKLNGASGLIPGTLQPRLKALREGLLEYVATAKKNSTAQAWRQMNRDMDNQRKNVQQPIGRVAKLCEEQGSKMTASFIRSILPRGTGHAFCPAEVCYIDIDEVTEAP